MDDYTKQLEQQNEHLRAKLAEAQMLLDWRDQCRSNRLQFHYEISFVFETSDSDPNIQKLRNWFVPRLTVKHMLRSIRAHPRSIAGFAGFYFLRNAPVKYYSIYLISARYKKEDRSLQAQLDRKLIYEATICVTM